MNKRTLSFIVVLIIGLTVFISLFTVPLFPVLAFEYINSGKPSAFVQVEDNQKFSILYTHSVHLTPVEEKYVLTDQHEIQQYELVYERYNVGMPSNVEEGEEFSIKDGKFHITNMNRSFPSINLSVGKIVANHRLIIENQIIPFSDFVEPGALIKIHNKKLTVFEYLKGDEIVVR